jgi:hypothetical protein
MSMGSGVCRSATAAPLVGIVTLDDALQVLTEQQIGLVKIVAQEQRHERHFRM